MRIPADRSEGARKTRWVVLPGLAALVLLAPLLFAQPFARKRLFGAALFSRLHVIAMLLDFFDDVFLLHFALETTQGIFQRLTFLNAYFSHLNFTVLPMHVAMIAITVMRLNEGSLR